MTELWKQWGEVVSLGLNVKGKKWYIPQSKVEQICYWYRNSVVTFVH